MTLVENLAPLFVDFGLTATVGGQPVRGIFDAAYQDAFGLVGGTAPVLVCATSSLAGVDYGTSVVINATNYVVAEMHPDGTGITRLVLELA